MIRLVLGTTIFDCLTLSTLTIHTSLAHQCTSELHWLDLFVYFSDPEKNLPDTTLVRLPCRGVVAIVGLACID